METINSKENKTPQQKPLGENTATYCFTGEIDWPNMGDGFVVVGDECDNYPCDQGFLYSVPTIVSKLDDIIWSTTFTNENGTRNFCPPTRSKGGMTRILFDGAFDVPFNSGKPIKGELISPYTIDACFNNKNNKWQYKINTNESENEIKLRVLVAMCHWNEPTDIHNIEDLNNIPEEDVCLALKDFEKHRPYQFVGMNIPHPEKYHIKDVTVNHEKVHVKFFQLDILSTLNKKNEYNDLVKPFKDNLQFTPSCTEVFKDKNTAIYQGKKYYDNLIELFVFVLKSNWEDRVKDNRKNENVTQWNDYNA